jgi:hypothetical protein
MLANYAAWRRGAHRGDGGPRQKAMKHKGAEGGKGEGPVLAHRDVEPVVPQDPGARDPKADVEWAAKMVVITFVGGWPSR